MLIEIEHDRLLVMKYVIRLDSIMNAKTNSAVKHTQINTNNIAIHFALIRFFFWKYRTLKSELHNSDQR